MITTCRRWAAAGTVWAYRDAATRVDNAAPRAAVAVVYFLDVVGSAVARAWRGGSSFLNVAGTLAVLADDVAAVPLHRRHGGPASHDPF